MDHSTVTNQMSTPYPSVIVMVIASIIIGYYLSMTVLIAKNRTHNRNKLYQALLMGVLMGVVELGMFIVFMGQYQTSYLIVLALLILSAGILVYLISNQVGIGMNQFMRSMIEHHEMAIQMANQVAPKVQDPELHNIVMSIQHMQQMEIDRMYTLLKKSGYQKADIASA